jgi:WD40 repeat protein
MDGTPSPSRANTIFISYSRSNQNIAQRLVQELKQRTIDPWFDREDIPQGATWWQQIKTGILAANSFVCLISTSSLRSEVCNWEVNFALTHNKRIIPVVIEDVFGDKSPSKALDELTWITPDDDRISAQDNWQRLRQINFIFLNVDDNFSFVEQIEAIVKVAHTDLSYVEEHTRLLLRAVQWDTRGRQRSFLLTGIEAGEAEEWLASGISKNPAPQTLHVEFIQVSRRAQRTSQRRLLLSVTAALMVMAALAILALSLFQQSQSNLLLSQGRGTEVAFERDRANTQATAVAEERDISESRRLAGLSTDTKNNEVRTLLAIRSLSSAYTTEAETALALALEDQGRTIQAHASLCCAVLSPNGHQLLTGSIEGEIALWNIALNETGGLQLSEVYRRHAHTITIGALAFSPDGEMFATGGMDSTTDEGDALGSFHLWNTGSGQLLPGMDDATTYGDYWNIAFAPDSSLFTVTESGIHVWNTKYDIKQSDKYAYYSGDAITAFALSPSGNFYLTATDPQIFDEGFVYRLINLVDAKSGTVLQEFRPADIVSSLLFIGEDRRVIAGDENGALSLLKFVSDDDPALREWKDMDPDHPFELDQQIYRFCCHTDMITSIALSSDQHLIATSGADGKTQLWNFGSHDLLRAISAGSSRIQSVIFLPDTTYLLTAEADGKLRLWDIDYHRMIQYACTHVKRDFYDAVFDFRTTDSEWRQYNISHDTPTCPQFTGQVFNHNNVPPP